MNYESFAIDAPKFESANCASIGDPDIFFPETKKEQIENLPFIRRICGSCIHRQECLDFAIEHYISDGIWGGLTERERIRLIPRKPSGKVINKSERAYLYYKRGMTIGEIADRMLMSNMAVEKAISRGKAKESES